MKTYNFYNQICRNILCVKSQPVIWAKSCYSSQTHYDLLQISPNASQPQIKAAYFRLSKKYHPDVNKGADAKQSFNKISEAYKVLSNTGQRTEYDRQLFHKTQRSSFASSSTTHQDFVYREPKAKSNTAQYQTGKTAHFDFDEFYRKHYPEMIRKARESRIKKENYEQEVRQRANDRTLRFMAQLISITVMILYLRSLH